MRSTCLTDSNISWVVILLWVFARPPKKREEKAIFRSRPPTQHNNHPWLATDFLFCFQKFSFFTFQDSPPTNPRQSCTYRPGPSAYNQREKKWPSGPLVSLPWYPWELTGGVFSISTKEGCQKEETSNHRASMSAHSVSFLYFTFLVFLVLWT